MNKCQDTKMRLMSNFQSLKETTILTTLMPRILLGL